MTTIRAVMIVAALAFSSIGAYAVEPGNASEHFFDRVDKGKSEDAVIQSAGKDVPPQQLAADRLACHSDDECVIVRNDCGDRVGNRNFAGQLEVLACVKSGPYFSKNAVARCVNSQCAAIVPPLALRGIPAATSCQHDEDCVLVDSCGDAAANQASARFYQSLTCLASTPHNPNAVARCINNQCKVILPPLKAPSR